VNVEDLAKQQNQAWDKRDWTTDMEPDPVQQAGKLGGFARTSEPSFATRSRDSRHR
jgi:hypothetical protein